jgi:hypothetical protein
MLSIFLPTLRDNYLNWPQSGNPEYQGRKKCIQERTKAHSILNSN